MTITSKDFMKFYSSYFIEKSKLTETLKEYRNLLKEKGRTSITPNGFIFAIQALEKAFPYLVDEEKKQ